MGSVSDKSMAASELATPEAVEAAFYRAFTTRDLELMAAVWARGDDVLCIHPGSGLLRGKSAVMQSWTEIFSGSTPPLIEHRFIQGFVAENLAVRLVEELIRPRGKPPEAANRLLATNVFQRLEGGGWRLAEHHASLPLMGKRKSAGEGRILH